MTAQKPSQHLGHLACAMATALFMTALLDYAAIRVDEPKAGLWTGTTGGIAMVWVFSLVWAAIAIGLTLGAIVRIQRATPPMQHRPAPGNGRDRSWTPREWELAEQWLAEQPTGVPPVDPRAAERPRPEQPPRTAHRGTPAVEGEPVAADIAEAAREAVDEAEYSEAAA